MKVAIFLFLAAILTGIIIQDYLMFKEINQLKKEFNVLRGRTENLKKEGEKIKSDLKYFSIPENLEKELRQKFNYKKPDEKMIIIIP